MSSSRVRDSSFIPAIPLVRYQEQNVRMLVRRFDRLKELHGWTSPEHDLMRARPAAKAVTLDGQGRLF